MIRDIVIIGFVLLAIPALLFYAYGVIGCMVALLQNPELLKPTEGKSTVATRLWLALGVVFWPIGMLVIDAGDYSP